MGLAVGIALGVLAVLLTSTWGNRPIRNVAQFGLGVQTAFLQSSLGVILGTISTTIAIVFLAAYVRCTGRHRERRDGRGRRESARSLIKASVTRLEMFWSSQLSGSLIIGVPYGLFNLSLATLITRYSANSLRLAAPVRWGGLDLWRSGGIFPRRSVHPALRLARRPLVQRHLAIRVCELSQFRDAPPAAAEGGRTVSLHSHPPAGSSRPARVLTGARVTAANVRDFGLPNAPPEMARVTWQQAVRGEGPFLPAAN